MDASRAIKDSYEIERIRRANEISASAHVAVLKNIRYFTNEAQIQAIFEGTCTSRLAKKQAYSVIAGSGENAAVLHYTKNDELLKGRQLVCLDAGAEYENYASDVTRTFPISGDFPSKEAEAIYKLVQEMQESVLMRLKPGVFMLDLHVQVAKVAIRGLLSLGVLKGDANEIYAAGTYRAFYPHGLGHHVGLEVHDILGIPILRYGSQYASGHMTTQLLAPCRPSQPPLEEGMVYFSRYELQRAYLSSTIHSKYIDEKVLEKYWAVGGVRIEDDLLITANGYENLTTAPKGEAALEIIRKGHDSC
ncbi:hypothetical protein MMC10_001380 [Thelotrema lepadinum]|nr:hypothetical protein [Thelotrema lepadinum]